MTAIWGFSVDRPDTFPAVTDALLAVLHEAATAVRSTLDTVEDWGLAGTRPGQYHSDLAADAAALAVLDGAGLGVLSEESGLHHADRPVLVVVDPVDGSTNASHGIPWFATSLCAVDAEGPLASVVVNQATGERFEAVRGGGARRDGVTIGPSGCTELGDAIVGLSGYPPEHLGWRQYRALGAAALDLCAVAAGVLDAYIDCSRDAHGPWDYLGGALVCMEAGALVVDLHGRDLLGRAHGDRRTVLAAATPALLTQVIQSRGKSG
jgi:myo-inositol-1(or 4)-monophosphatase